MVHLVQISNGVSRRVAMVEEPRLRCLEGVESVYEHGSDLSAGGWFAERICAESCYWRVARL